MFDVIEQLKSDWTDKYVVVDAAVPELARFGEATGLVRTVNMNGRCLVEFDQFNNVAWYDIDPSYLKVVPKPQPKPAGEKPAKAAKPAAKKPAAKAAAAKGSKPSTADILAAARGKKAAAAPAAAKPAGGRPSTADILAMARSKKAAAGAEPAAAEPAAAEPVADEPAAEPEVVAEAPPAAAAADGPMPTTTTEKIAWCRAHDGKGG
ncbi:MAG: hypothetical protein ISQ07_05765 [Pirellulales bacterium]|jgi:pyruvate/2-oxoglutarate dehydrogenase complex dihydrolipoamide acyltransferase (E2) component|nr:hypothetical protein [Pirellulales bacterium]